MAKSNKNKAVSDAPDEPPKKKRCGIVMPISEIDGCSAQHWQDVLEIFKESLCDTEFEARLVSEADDVGVIQKRIIQNLYNNEIVVCDVSGLNPNVMFELGMRLAFNKPTIIVKDDKTRYSFDTSIIEHIPYPRDLRFSAIVGFKEKLASKIEGTWTQSKKNGFTPFLNHFGQYTVAELPTDVLPEGEAIFSELKEMRREMMMMRSMQMNATPMFSVEAVRPAKTICLHGSEANVGKFRTNLMKDCSLASVTLEMKNKTHFHIKTEESLKERETEIKELAKTCGVRLGYVT